MKRLGRFLGAIPGSRFFGERNEIEMTSTILFVLYALSGHPRAQETKIRIPLAGDIDEVTFDSAQVPPSEVKRWIRLSPNVGPYNNYLVPENIELCKSDDTRYEGCGKEQEGVNLHNAQLNLDTIRGRIRALDPDRYPADLKEVVVYVRRIQSFALWAETQKLAFVESGDVSILESTFTGGIDPKRSCGTVLDRITKAENQAERSKLARFDWFNCVLEVQKQRIGEYPQGAWEKFLADHGIREHFIQEEVND